MTPRFADMLCAIYPVELHSGTEKIPVRYRYFIILPVFLAVHQRQQAIHAVRFELLRSSSLSLSPSLSVFLSVSVSVCLSVSISLSHTHTHTHTLAKLSKGDVTEEKFF